MPAAVPNLFVAKEVPVRSALYHADVVLQRGCTTASESWMLGKPVVEMEIGRYHQSIRSDYKAGNETVTNGLELERTIERYLSGAPVPRELLDAREKFIRKVYGDVSGRSSEMRDAIDAIVGSPDQSEAAQLDRRARIQEEWRKHQETSDNRISNRIKDAVGLERHKSFRLWRRSVWESWLKPKPGERNRRGAAVSTLRRGARRGIDATDRETRGGGPLTRPETVVPSLVSCAI
jgi:hypothetical protein